jgi:hypothetical protein
MNSFSSKTQATLKLHVEIAPFTAQVSTKQRDIEIYLTQYALALRDDLRLPAEISLTVQILNRDELREPQSFRVFINERPCRIRWWPQVLPADLPAQEISAVICQAIHANRELLLSDITESISREWEVRKEDGYVRGWSADGFREFLATFVRRNFSIERGRAFVQTCETGASEKPHAAYLFEEALEKAADLSFGIRVFVGPEQSKDEIANCRELLIKSELPWLREHLGLVLPEIQIVEGDGTLQKDEFRIQLNDVSLPVLRRPLEDEMAVPAYIPIVELTKLGVKSRLIVDPFAAFNWQVMLVSGYPGIGKSSSGGDSVEKFRKTNPESWRTSVAYLRIPIRYAVVYHGGSCLAAPVIQFLLDRLSEEAPDLVRLAEKRFSFPKGPSFTRRITATLRNLLDEQVPIRDLRGILESLLALREVSNRNQKTRVYHFGSTSDMILVADGKRISDLSVADLSACARLGVRSLGAMLAEPVGSQINLLGLQKELAVRIRQESQLPLSEEELWQIRSSVLTAVQPYWAPDRVPVLVSQDIRNDFADLLRVEFPDVVVLGENEIPSSHKGLIHLSISVDPFQQSRASE